MLRKLIRSNINDLWLFVGVEGGIFLLVEVIIGCVMFFARPVDGVSVAWIMLPIVAGFVSLMAIIGHAALTFDLALRFGQTRRRALGQFFVLSCFETAFGLVLAALLSAAERFVCPALWAGLAGLDGWVLSKGPAGAMLPVVPDMPGMDVEPVRMFVNSAGEIMPVPEGALLVRDFTLDWYWWLLIFVIALAGGFVIGALIQRFGQKGIWVVSALWIVPFLLNQFSQSEIFDRVSYVSPLFFPLLAGLLAAGALLWSLWSMLHAVVRA